MDIKALDISAKLSVDASATEAASQDFGHIVKAVPKAVLHPSTPQGIAALIKLSYYYSSVRFGIAAKGQGHSLWIDVLNKTLEHGLAPVSWADYLYLTVGGTLSNAGISGQTFRYGPQISNVLEMDVITGKADLMTCSPMKNSELFYAVLRGLGQFGIVNWIRVIYSDFSSFTGDQELLISRNGRKDNNALDYLEGSLLMDQGSPDNWRFSFFQHLDHPRIISLITEHRIIYCLEVVKHYNDQTKNSVDKVMKQILQGLSYMPGFMFQKEAGYEEFLTRVRSGELKLESQGLWEVPHPWLNLFIPKSQILDFNDGVFRGIVLEQNITTGPVLVYPMNRQKWDKRMSAVIPDEEIFYTVGFLHSSGLNDWGAFEYQNKEIMRFCKKAGIMAKQYLPHYSTIDEWVHHFGSKRKIFQQRKLQFDPRMLLSPGQNIFNNN
ncbi:Cytokinin dehydrogenase 3 [Hibiscus syriacus]|uniref:cytokinin dehydrogenase n=1 Tax=Hibiscus syriacus TaxID=106335 RepID=A0A6A2YG87_HIBSY|nr:Cytokinin dehydrogenase 3 [Hibiscus syriacus]